MAAGAHAGVSGSRLDSDPFNAHREVRTRERSDPPVRTPSVVAGSAYPDAPLIAVNTAAKRAGVRSGDRVRDAREWCPGFAVRSRGHCGACAIV